MTMDRDSALDMLDEVECLLRDMLDLAQLSASDRCSDVERAQLQRELAALRRRIDRTVDLYQETSVLE